MFHFVTNEFDEIGNPVGGCFKDEFIVDLKKESGGMVRLSEFPVDANHGEFDEIGGGSLDDGVDGGSFGEIELLTAIATGANPGDGTTAAFDGLHEPLTGTFVEDFGDETGDA